MKLTNVNWAGVRTAVYALATAAVGMLGALGVIAPERVDGISQAVTAAIGAAAAILARVAAE